MFLNTSKFITVSYIKVKELELSLKSNNRGLFILTYMNKDKTLKMELTPPRPSLQVAQSQFEN